jgi:phosphoglycolate phosphatase
MQRDIIGALADIDDTLIPWEVPHSLAYPAMSRALSEKSGLPEEQLIAEIKEVNSRYGTIEYTALIQEMPSFRNATDKKQKELINLAIESRRQAVEGLTKPFEGVKILLQTLQVNRLIQLALSDAPVNLAYLRLKKAKLLKYFDLVAGSMSPGDHLFAPEHRMGNKPYLVPVKTVEEKKPQTDLGRLLHLSDEKVGKKYFLYGNSSHSDQGLARRFGMLFYQTGWDHGTNQMRETLLRYAPAPILAANVALAEESLSDQNTATAKIETHPNFEMVKVQTPLEMIRDLHRRGIIRQIPPTAD